MEGKMGTHYSGTEEEVKALDAYIKLMRAAESVTTRVHRHLAHKGLTVSRFGVLEALYHLGPLSQSDLGRKLLKSGGNITLVVDNLEKLGLVRRERLSGDRRYVEVHLTEQGRQLIGEVFPVHVRAVVDEMKTLAEPEQEQLGFLCRKLGMKLGNQPKPTD